EVHQATARSNERTGRLHPFCPLPQMYPSGPSDHWSVYQQCEIQHSEGKSFWSPALSGSARIETNGMLAQKEFHLGGDYGAIEALVAILVGAPRRNTQRTPYVAQPDLRHLLSLRSRKSN